MKLTFLLRDCDNGIYLSLTMATWSIAYVHNCLTIFLTNLSPLEFYNISGLVKSKFDIDHVPSFS